MTKFLSSDNFAADIVMETLTIFAETSTILVKNSKILFESCIQYRSCSCRCVPDLQFVRGSLQNTQLKHLQCQHMYSPITVSGTVGLLAASVVAAPICDKKLRTKGVVVPKGK